MSRGRIYFFNRFFWPDQSATAQILTDLCRSLKDEDYLITVVASRLDYDNRQVQYQDREFMENVAIVRLWSTRFGRGNILGRLSDYLTIYLSFFIYMVRNISVGDIVVMKTDPPLLSILGAVAKVLKGNRLISWCQDIFPEVAMAEMRPSVFVGFLFNILGLVRDWSLRLSDRVVVLGKDMERYLAGRDIPSGKMVCISNWSIQADIDPTIERKLRAEWGIPSDCFVIGYSGNLGRAHDWKTLLDTAREMQYERNLLFLFCGAGHGYDALKREVKASGFEKLFQFRGYQPQERLASSLKVPDLHWFTLKNRLTSFIFPSKFFGILQAGRPVLFVGKGNCEIADIIREHQIGAVIQEGDSQALREAIDPLRVNAEAATSAGYRSRKLWEGAYQKPVEIAKWRVLLNALGEQQT